MEQWLFTACLALAGLMAVLHWRVLDDELPGPFFTAGRWDTWCVHHDEKLVIPDVRAFFLGEAGLAGLDDYRPYPVCAAFGVAGPWLSVLGLRLFGFGNVGLRLWSLGAMLLRQYCLIVLCFALLPPWPAAALCALFATAYNQFVLDHHAVLENLLGAVLCAVAWACLVHPEATAQGAFALGVALAALILVKPNFPTTAGLLAACLLFAGPGGWRAVWRLGLGFCLGGVMFEALQVAILWRLGQVRHRYRNLLDALRVHSGREHEFLQKFFKPIGWAVFPRFCVLAVDWLADTKWRNMAAATTGPTVFAFACLLFVAAPVGGGAGAWGLLAFLTLYLALLAPFFYYPKRAVPVLPLYDLLVAVKALAWGASLGQPQTAAWLLGLGAAGLTLRNVWLLARRLPGRTRGVVRGSRELETHIPAGSTVRTQCYGYRFLWQVRGRRLLSGDDQVLDNRRTEALARSEHVDYLLLSNLAPADLDRLGREYRWLGTLSMAASDADLPLRFDLFSRREPTS